MPSYETDGSAGADLRAYLKSPVTLMPGERRLIPTGLFIELPDGIEAQVRARSGLSIKHGISLVNGVGTVDSDYRGEWNVPVINFGSEPYTIHDGDRDSTGSIFIIHKWADFEITSQIVIPAASRRIRAYRSKMMQEEDRHAFERRS